MPFQIKSRFTIGELDPRLWERTDLEQWHKACELAKNVEFLPQGGFRHRPGQRRMARLRRCLEPLELRPDMITAHAGGDVNALLDDGDARFVTNVMDNSEAVILTVDLGQLTSITFVDVLGFSLKNYRADKALLIESSPDGTRWNPIGCSFDITNTDRSRRFGESKNFAARYIRVVLALAGYVDDKATATVTDESNTAQRIRVGGLVFENPVNGATSNADTLDDSRADGAFWIKSLKIWKEGDALSNSCMFTLSMSGQETWLFVATDRNLDVFEKGAWLVSLPLNADSGQIPALTSASSLTTLLLFHMDLRPLRIHRQGDGPEWNVDYPVWENVPDLKENIALGEASGKLMDNDNGWPRCGAFFQSRLWLGGFRSAPTTFMASTLGHYFDFNMDIEESDAALQYTLDSDEQETIRRIFVGRHLQFFTDQSEWYCSNRSIDANQPLNMVMATRNGIAANPRIVFVQGGTLFAQKGGGVLRDFFYSDVEQSYSANSGALFGSHLIGDVVSVAHRRAAGVDEGHMIYIINADGTASCMTMLREHKVSAQSRLVTTGGKYRSVIVDAARDVFFVVERDGEYWLEIRDETCLLDASLKFSSADGQSRLSGLDYPDGLLLHVFGDGSPVGLFRPQGGQIDLGTKRTQIEVGIFPDLRVTTLPLRRKDQTGREITRPARIFRMAFSLLKTGQLSFHVEGQPARFVGLHNHGAMSLDVPLMDQLVSHEIVLDRITGWYKAPRVTILREWPAPMTVLAVKMEVA